MGACGFFWIQETKQPCRNKLTKNTNQDSKISWWIILIEVMTVSITENCLQDKACKFELVDSNLNFQEIAPATGITTVTGQFWTRIP